MSNYNLEINEINQQIQDLQIKRTEIINAQLNIETDKIAELAWTKNHHAIFKYFELWGPGSPAYKIIVTGNPPLTTKHITVMGTSKNYENNITYSKEYMEEHMCFTTSSMEMLLEFLNKVVFRSLSYDKNLCLVLNHVKQKSEALEILQAAAKAENN